MPRKYKYVTLDGCEVVKMSAAAVCVAWEDARGEVLTHWIPRSVCQDGDTLDLDDTDIAVADWFVKKEDLPTGD